MLMRLLKKEFALAMHPVMPVMLALGGMAIIPNYPYTVIFFYMTLGVFFTCLQGRENNDVVYTVSLPIAKCDAVRARFAFTVLLQCLQAALVMAVGLLKTALRMPANVVGLEANAALAGVGLLLFAAFNACFFLCYYRDVRRVGSSFIKASAIFFLLACVAEVLPHTVPFFRDILDTVGSQFRMQRILTLAVCATVYALTTWAVCRRSTELLEQQDL